VSGDRCAASGQNLMREDWNRRAREDAHYYVAFGRREQEEGEFLATGARLVQALEDELKRLPATGNRRRWRALEIGCGPGRLMKPLSRNFGEIHGVDVSDEMIALARERLRDVAHAHVHVTDGASLAAFADESFDFVYSYAVFQHVPSRDVVWSCLEETRRVLRPGGIFRGQLNGLPPLAEGDYDTWAGCRFTADEIRAFASERGFDLLELSGLSTQYMWTTWRRRGDSMPVSAAQPVRVRRVTNAFSTEPLAPASGRYAAISMWIENLPAACELNGLDASIAGAPATLFYIGPPAYDGLQQLSTMLPPGVPTGLQPVVVRWRGEPVCQTILRVVPPGPRVPRILAINDAVNLLSAAKISSGLVKIVTEQLSDPSLFTAAVDGLPITEVQSFCTDPQPPRFEFNLRLPQSLQPGAHTLHLQYGRRRFAPVGIELA
jgi:SAM-dependent methyltransferase